MQSVWWSNQWWLDEDILYLCGYSKEDILDSIDKLKQIFDKKWSSPRNVRVHSLYPMLTGYYGPVQSLIKIHRLARAISKLEKIQGFNNKFIERLKISQF